MLGASGDQSGTTTSAIANGTIVITSDDAASQETADSISRDTGSANDGAITQEFDEEKRAEIQEGFEVTKDLIAQTSIFFANRAAEEKAKRKEAKDNEEEANRLKAIAADPTAKDENGEVLTAEARKTLNDSAAVLVTAGLAALDEADEINRRFKGGSPARIIATAINGAAGGNAAGGFGDLVQAASVNVLQSLATTQVKSIADGINGDDSVREGVRAALQAVVGCAGSTAGGSGDCGSAAIGASASVVINNLISNQGDEPKDLNDDGNIDPAELEDQQARSNLVATIIGAIAVGAGLDAPGAVTAAQIETENNAVGPSSCKDEGPDDSCFTLQEVKDNNQVFFDADIISEFNLELCIRLGKASCKEGRDVVLESFNNSGLDVGNAFDNISDQELVDRYTVYENTKLQAFLQVNARNKLLLPTLVANPALFAQLSPEDRAVITLAFQYQQENPITAGLAAGPAAAVLTLDNEFQILTRAAGLGQAVLGGLGAVTAFTAAAAAAPACVTVVGCLPTVGLGVLGVIEVDQAIAGAQTFINGEQSNSFAALGVEAATDGAITADQAEIIVGGVTLVGSLSGSKFIINQQKTAQRGIDNSVDYAKHSIANSDINLPNTGSLDEVATRQWYLEQEARIPNLLDETASLEDQARQAWALRNEFRTAARKGMADRSAAAVLDSTRPNLTWEQTVAKYHSSFQPKEELWKSIIEASQRSNPGVNESLGLRPPGGN